MNSTVYYAYSIIFVYLQLVVGRGIGWERMSVYIRLGVSVSRSCELIKLRISSVKSLFGLFKRVLPSENSVSKCHEVQPISVS